MFIGTFFITVTAKERKILFSSGVNSWILHRNHRFIVKYRQLFMENWSAV